MHVRVYLGGSLVIEGLVDEEVPEIRIRTHELQENVKRRSADLYEPRFHRRLSFCRSIVSVPVILPFE